MVIQLGNLVHRGPHSAGGVAIARTIMATQPERWIQLTGNHESLFLAPPLFHWPERLQDWDAETLFGWWPRRTMRIAAAVDTPDGCWLLTHAGHSEGFWRHFLGMRPARSWAPLVLHDAVALDGRPEAPAARRTTAP